MIRKNIPNFITTLNVISGSVAVVFALEGHLLTAVILLFAASLFDFLDGMSARLLKAYSPMGKELDSLADMISFGLAPGVIVFSMMRIALFNSCLPITQIEPTTLQWFFLALPLLIPALSAIRLAKFNIDTRQSSSFIGFPTPANALFFSSLALISLSGRFPKMNELLLNPISLSIFTVVLSLLLVSEVPMFSLKFKNLQWSDNKLRFIFLGSSIVLLALFGAYGLTASILLFILLSALFSRKIH